MEKAFSVNWETAGERTGSGTVCLQCGKEANLEDLSKKWKVYGSFSDFRLFLFLHNTTLSSVFIHLHMEVSKSQDNLKTRLSLRDKADSGF